MCPPENVFQIASACGSPKPSCEPYLESVGSEVHIHFPPATGIREPPAGAFARVGVAVGGCAHVRGFVRLPLQTRLLVKLVWRDFDMTDHASFLVVRAAAALQLRCQLPGTVARDPGRRRPTNCERKPRPARNAFVEELVCCG